MHQIVQTAYFKEWFADLTDDRARAAILARVRRLSLGHFGDAKAVGGGVLEMRIHFGPGYRVYFVRRGAQVILLFIGGDKRSQSKDIESAVALAKSI